MRSKVLASLIGLAALPWAGVALGQGIQTAPYDELTNNYEAVTNFNVETTRGMVVTGGAKILAINTHGSLLHVIDPTTLLPILTVPTLNNPVAVSVYTQRDASGIVAEYAVVLCAGSHALCMHDIDTGQILEVMHLPAEPGDLVVDSENHIGFASLPGNNTVVQVALPSLTLDATFTVASQRPRYLHLDLGTLANPTDNQVFVTPELSSNNTLSYSAFEDGVSILPGSPRGDNMGSIDLSGTLNQGGGLPDEDLYRLDAQASGEGVHVVVKAVAVLRNVGTVLMAHGRNPVSDQYWIVGTDAKNSLADNEPALSGVFSENRLTIAPRLWISGDAHYSNLPYKNTHIDLDRDPTSQNYSSDHSNSIPSSLSFHPIFGFGVIAGAASDRVRFVDVMGQRGGDQDMPEGSIPRQVMFTPDGFFHLVYCWGSNEIRVYNTWTVILGMNASSNLVAPEDAGLIGTIDLGVDPTPPKVARGREIFYDADRSLDGRTTCGHCHPGGGMDLIGWNIQDFPHDYKDIMVTQSLKSIEDTFPYHWRGERDLEAFNGAFTGILGGLPLLSDTTDPELIELGLTVDGDGIERNEDSEFEDFKAFIFSLQTHSNPNQHITRQLRTGDPDYPLPLMHFLTQDPLPGGPNPPGPVVPMTGTGDPILGQALMDEGNTLFNRFSCTDCHGKQTGSVGETEPDDLPGLIAGNVTMDVAHFRQLFHKQQDVVEISYIDPAGSGAYPWVVPRSGYGMSHDGNHPSTMDFLLRNGFMFDAPDANPQGNIGAFVQLADEGIAPAAHFAVHLNAGTDFSVWTEAEDILNKQAEGQFDTDHWIDLAIVGTHMDNQGVIHELRWHYDFEASAFIPSDRSITFPDSSTGFQSWASLRGEGEDGSADFVLLGLPPGNGFRWAIDRDNDQLDATDEAATGGDWDVVDTDNDTYLDGHEFENGGNVMLQSVTPNDMVDPSVLSGRIDHEGASYIKLVLEFSEPVTYTVTANSPTTGSVDEHRFEFVQHDTVTVQRLIGSIPEMNQPGSTYPPVSPIPNDYTFTVTMTDLVGNTGTSVLTGTVGTTKDLLIDFTFVGASKPAFLQRTISRLHWNPDPQVSTSSFIAGVSVDHRFDAPEVANLFLSTPNGNTTPVDNQIVVAQVVHTDVSGNRTVLDSSGTTITVNSPQGLLYPDLLFDAPDPMNPPIALPIDGPFLFSTTTDQFGTAQFEFNLSPALSPGEKVHLNVIGIYEKARTTPAQLPNQVWSGSFGVYNMPATSPRFRSLLFKAP
ncbi:MAG: hypothetical protein ACI835_001766 [Planctomycetota bacterium]|jgi:hypothetical protein